MIIEKLQQLDKKRHSPVLGNVRQRDNKSSQQFAGMCRIVGRIYDRYNGFQSLRNDLNGVSVVLPHHRAAHKRENRHEIKKSMMHIHILQKFDQHQ